MKRALFLVYGLMLGGCAFGPGQGFAVLQPSVRAAYETLASRAAGEGYERLSSDYQARVDTGVLRLSGISLLASASGPGGSFDPAHPPAGYTLCHGGHCHRQDGALIPYEQVAAELAGGGAGASAVVTLPVEDALQMLAAQPREVSCEPGCDLPETRISQVRWSVHSLRFTGSVRDGRVPARFSGERRFEVDLTPATDSTPTVASLSGPVDLTSDRTEPPATKLDLSLVLTAAFFDAVDWTTLTPDSEGVVHINVMTPTVHTALIERLSGVSPKAEVSRVE